MGEKISEMTAAITIDGTELIPIVQSGVNKSVTPAVLLDKVRPEYIYFLGGTIRIGVPSAGTYAGELVFQKIIGAGGFAGTEGVDWENIGGAI